tara:strand:- start:269 stop:733 length:465 start_codon:yes stop_codon:yes gene_type:complete
MNEERYEVLVYYAPEEGEIYMYGAPDEVRSYKVKAEAIADYKNVVHYYYKEVMYYYNEVDADCVVNDINEYLEEVFSKAKRLQYLEKYAPTFQVFAQNEEGMEEEYTQHGSLKECEEYIAILEDGWIGSIEVIEDYVITNNPQVKTLEEWRNEG